LVDYAALCDYASDRGGAVVACGLGINRLTVAQVPSSHPQLFLVAQVRQPGGAAERRQVSVSLLDPNQEPLSEISGALQFAATGEGEAVGRIVLGFYSVQFNRYGTYRFLVKVQDGCEIALPFHVRPPG